MNLLPKTHEEFAQKDYWNAFFKKRGEKAFEWYGEYIELCEHIHKYAKTVDNILMLGCGNSKLSMDMFDVGYKNITNIDISPVAIKKMKDINGLRPEMSFIQMDATAMTFPDEHFSVAIDKGTLDALYVDDTPKVKETVDKYFNEIKRTMRNGGRYVCITLLQEHILKYVVDYFPKNAFMLRIVYCYEAERANQERNSEEGASLPVFIVVATKFKSLPTPVLEFSLSNVKMQRVKSPAELISAVASVQKAALVCNGLAKNNIADQNEVKLDLCKLGEETPRYTLHILDQPPARGLNKYAAFIVPQGREIEWLFSTPQGRRKLQESANYQRLAVVSLHRDQDYESLDAVKSELSYSIKNLAPSGLNGQIPFLSIGSDVGKRETLVSGFSGKSGEFRIEEVEGAEEKLFRRLIFLNNPFVVQSEALVKTIKRKGRKEKKKIDFSHLACHHHLYMSVGVQMVSTQQKQKHILVVGLGGGGLCSFLHETLPECRIVAVEIDPIMLEIAEQYFELKQDKNFTVVIDDGLSFLERCITEQIHFDAVLFDVDSKDLTVGISCPPLTFLESNVLANVKEVIGQKGLFILNLVCRNDELRLNTINKLKQEFSTICCYQLDADVNEVIYCSNDDDKLKTTKEWQRYLGNSGRKLNDAVREHHLRHDDVLNVTDYINQLKI